MPVHITSLIKQQHSQTSACWWSLLINNSAGGQMALGSHSLTPELINQFLQQLWVIACALKFNSQLYEVQFCVNYANKLRHCTNCTCFCECWPNGDLNIHSTVHPLPLWHFRLQHVELERLKGSSCGVDLNFHTPNMVENTPSGILLTWWKDLICADVLSHMCLGRSPEIAQWRTVVSVYWVMAGKKVSRTVNIFTSFILYLPKQFAYMFKHECSLHDVTNSFQWAIVKLSVVALWRHLDIGAVRANFRI